MGAGRAAFSGAANPQFVTAYGHRPRDRFLALNPNSAAIAAQSDGQVVIEELRCQVLLPE